MSAFIDVRFQGLDHDASVESAIHRWVARLAAMGIEITRAMATVEALGRRRVMVCLTAVLPDRSVRTADTIHSEVYVAVGDAFRALRRQVTQPLPLGRAMAYA